MLHRSVTLWGEHSLSVLENRKLRRYLDRRNRRMKKVA